MYVELAQPGFSENDVFSRSKIITKIIRTPLVNPKNPPRIKLEKLSPTLLINLLINFIIIDAKISTKRKIIK